MQTQQTLGDTRRALLLTDVVDSTRISLAAGEAEMARMWAAHDRAARELLLTWNGREIDKTDGLLALFDRAADAAGYALAYHQALAALGLPFRARVGLHVGPLALRENSAADVERGAKRFEVDGMAKPIVARVMATARGGQTLISAAAREAIAVEASDASSNAMRIESHGHWRFKGLPEPMELFEIGDDAAPFTPPPDEAKAYRVVRRDTPGSTAAPLWQPVREIKHSMPAERDSFVGRDEPLRWLADKLDRADVRLVSVLGIGGTGKTRFVTRYAWTWLGDYPGGVWFCDLAQARTLDGIYFAVAQGLDVPLGKTDPAIQLAHAIAGRGECLVIFDNFEQVAKRAEETVGRWLDRAPKAKFVVTTREVLGIVGEETLMLDPLPPDDAADLFIRRACAAKHDFRVRDNDERTAIQQLVKVLDGLPLAIELAAARVRAMTPGVLLSRMNERFEVLLSRAGRNDRQATLRAALDWSWDLLSDAEKAALTQISVFDGGFTLAAAEAILNVSSIQDAPSTTDLVLWLADKSLVFVRSGERYEVLQCVREYASEHWSDEHIASTPSMCESATLARHWKYFARLTETEAVANGCVEANNLIGACRRAAAAEDEASAIDALLNAWAALRLRGPLQLALTLAHEVAQIPGLSTKTHAWASCVTGSALSLLGDLNQAREHLERGLSSSRTCKDARCEGRLLLALGVQQTTQGLLEEALGNLAAAQRLATRCRDDALAALTLTAKGRLMQHQSRTTEARLHYGEALAMARQLRDERLEGGLLGNLGVLSHQSGALREAEQSYGRALALAQATGDRAWEGNTRSNLGMLYLQDGQASKSLRHFETALSLARELGEIELAYTVQCNLAISHQEAGNHDEASLLLEGAVTGAVAASDRRSEAQFRGYLALSHSALGMFTSARSGLDLAESFLSEIGDHQSLAILLCQRANVERVAGNIVDSNLALGRAEALARELSLGPESEAGRSLAMLRATEASSTL